MRPAPRLSAKSGQFDARSARSVFPRVHAAGENRFYFFRACQRELCQAFLTVGGPGADGSGAFSAVSSRRFSAAFFAALLSPFPLPPFSRRESGGGPRRRNAGNVRGHGEGFRSPPTAGTGPVPRAPAEGETCAAGLPFCRFMYRIGKKLPAAGRFALRRPRTAGGRFCVWNRMFSPPFRR